MSANYISINNSKVHKTLYNFINLEVLPNLKISEKEFWNGFMETANELAQINRDLLKKRDEIQRKKEAFQKKRKGLMAKGQIKSKQ